MTIGTQSQTWKQALIQLFLIIFSSMSYAHEDHSHFNETQQPEPSTRSPEQAAQHLREIHMGVLIVAASMLIILTAFVLVAKLYWDWVKYRVAEQHYKITDDVAMQYI